MSRLEELQNKILRLRKEKKLILQNGDTGFGQAPSNIALIKYWGKEPGKKQIPENSSLSFTLNHLVSKTKVTALGRFFPESQETTQRMSHQIWISSQSESTPKMNSFLDSILSPYANEIGIKIESQNNFPTACGIASSASGYAALCKAIADLLQLEKHFSQDDLQYWLYEWSRLGSGSATRSASLDPNSLFVSWEKTSDSKTITSSVPFHENLKNLKHCVFVLNDNPKSVSSSEGHQYAHTSPFHNIRVAGVEEKMRQMKKALVDFDFKTMVRITEEDAFAMHSVMQTGSPSACYLNKMTSDIISHFVKFRDSSHINAFWTLDAGPNVHFLFLPEAENHLHAFHADMESKCNQTIRVLK